MKKIFISILLFIAGGVFATVESFVNGILVEIYFFLMALICSVVAIFFLFFGLNEAVTWDLD